MSMDSKEREELCNTCTEEETLQKKRTRRVSFAEITSIHVFDRDEDFETPPDSKPSSENSELGPANEDLGFRRDSFDSDDSKELSQNEDDDEDVRELFVRDLDSSSPGSAIGSAASNDEDNFFGPVSASFIKSGQLSNSAASDDNHDITLDSTAFSWHFRSLAQSDSGRDYETPTEGHISFEEKTPTQSPTLTNMGSFMVLTGAKKPLPRLSVSDGRSSGGHDSNDMSLVEENPHRYDYGRLSPGLDALLAEGDKDLNAVSVSVHANYSTPSDNVNINNFSSFDEHENWLMDLKDPRSNGLVNIDTSDTPVEMVTDVGYKLHETNGGSMTRYDHLFSTKDAPTDQQNQTLNGATMDIPFGEDKDSEDVSLELSGSKSEVAFGSSGNLKHLNVMLQRNLIKQHESRFPGENPIKQNSPKDERCTPDIGRNFDQQFGSPLFGSVSSLRAKRRQICLNTDDSARNERIATPFARQQQASHLSRKNMAHDEKLSSIKQRISKFEILNTSPIDVPPELGVDNSKPAVSVSFDKVINENCEVPKQKLVDVSFSGSQGHPFSVSKKNRGQKISMESFEVKTPETLRSLPAEESMVPIEGGEHMDLTTGILSSGQYNKVVVDAASTFQFSCTAKIVEEHFLTYQSPSKVSSVTPEPDSSLVEATLHARGSEQVACVSDKFICSPIKLMEKKSSDSLYHEGIHSEALKQPGHEALCLDLRLDETDLIDNAPLESITPTINKLGFSIEEENMRSGSSSIRINSKYMKDFGQWETVGNKESLLHDLQKESGNIEDNKTPLRVGANFNCQSGSRAMNLQTGTDPTRFKKKIPERVLRPSLCESASPYVSKRTTTVAKFEKHLVELTTQSPSRKEFFNLSDIDSAISSYVGKDPHAPKSIQCVKGNALVDFHQALNIVDDQLSVQDVENSSGRKRRIEEIILRDKEQIDELGSIQKCLKVCKKGYGNTEFSFELSNVRNIEAENIGSRKMLIHWGDAFLKLCDASKQLFLPSTHKLGLQELEIVEDILVRLQKAKKYEKLSSNIRSQRIHDRLGSLQQNRVAETRWMLHMLAYEQAKLQLMRLKRDGFLKRVQLLKAGIQEYEVLKFNSSQNLILPGAIDDENMDKHIRSIAILPNGKNEDACKVTVMRQELVIVDQKIKNLTKSFHTSLKIKGEPSSSETIVSANDFLKNRSRCRVTQQDMQLWNVDVLERRDGCHNVGLNYSIFLFQRLKINVSTIPSLGISNKLNDINIMKNFPNMNAYSAFAFVLNSLIIQKHSDPKHLSQATQITSSLLGNLLDVIEEVQVARMELPNLIKTSFQSSFADQLNLELCFVDFKTGRKVILTLDMGLLKGGIYPLEILPSEMQSHLSTQASIPHSLLTEITTAIGGLEAGHFRIIRLCRCVSQFAGRVRPSAALQSFVVRALAWSWPYYLGPNPGISFF